MSKTFLRAINVVALCLVSLACGAEESPPWAYPTPPPGYKPSPDDGSPRHVPQSNKTYSTSQVRDLFLAPACSTCHGKDLRGLGAIPSIAGRSPTYLFRQLHEFKIGSRAGPGAAPMKEAVSRLSHADMIAISAYAASLPP